MQQAQRYPISLFCTAVFLSFKCSLVEKESGGAYHRRNSELELHVLLSYGLFNKLGKGREAE